jgi:Cu(I)/Ag(I) efflux system membrane fusion protein
MNAGLTPAAMPTTAPEVQTVAASDRIAVAHADELLAAYLALAEQLGQRQSEEKPVDAKPLVDVAQRAVEYSQTDAKALVDKVLQAVNAIVGKPLPEQREGFVAVSEAVIPIAERAKVSKAVAPTLFVMHCPMAFDDKGARWLQRQEQIANPYYAVQMKRCGEVAGRIELLP